MSTPSSARTYQEHPANDPMDAFPATNGRILVTGRIFFAAGIFGIGTQLFIFGGFPPVMLPRWSALLPWASVWAYVWGAYLVTTASLIAFGRNPRSAAMAAGISFLALFFCIQIPFNALNNLLVIGRWTNAFKEFAFAGSAFVVAGTFPKDRNTQGSFSSPTVMIERKLLAYARYPLAFMVALFGVDHFVYTTFVASLVPSWIPGPVFWTYFAGIALIASGVGIFLNMRLVATMLGVMLLIWVVTLHIPRAIADPSGGMGNEWTSVFEALAFSGIAFILGQTLPRPSSAPIAKTQARIVKEDRNEED